MEHCICGTYSAQCPHVLTISSSTHLLLGQAGSRHFLADCCPEILVPHCVSLSLGLSLVSQHGGWLPPEQVTDHCCCHLLLIRQVPKSITQSRGCTLSSVSGKEEDLRIHVHVPKTTIIPNVLLVSYSKTSYILTVSLPLDSLRSPQILNPLIDLSPCVSQKSFPVPSAVLKSVRTCQRYGLCHLAESDIFVGKKQWRGILIRGQASSYTIQVIASP